MKNHDDELDRFLDGLTERSSAAAPALDHATVHTARLLFQRAAAIVPSPAYVARLERTLTTGAASPRAAKGTRQRHLARAWAGRALGAAAIAAMAMIAMVVVYNSGPDEPNFAVASVAASPSSNPARAECDRDPVPDQAGRGALSTRYGPSLIAAIPAVQRPAPFLPGTSILVIPISKLPLGASPNQETRAGVTAAVRREIACRNYGMYGWAGREAVGSPSLRPAATPGATAVTRDGGPVLRDPLPVPASVSMMELSGNRVGVLFPQDLEGDGVEAFAIYASYEGDWYMINYGLVATDGWLAATYRGAPSSSPITVNLEDTYVWPLEAAILPGRPYRLTVVNHGSTSHSITIGGRAGVVTVAPGASETLELTADRTVTSFTVDIDPESQSPSGGYIWSIDTNGTPTAAAAP